LHWAVRKGWEKLMEVLLKSRDQKLNAKDVRGKTPLHNAAINNNSYAATRLLSEGAFPDIPDSLGKTPLHIAAEFGSEKVLTLLLDHGVDIEARDNLRKTADYRGRTPLHIAALCGCPATVQLLLKTKFIDVNAKDNSHNTALHFAAHSRSLSVVKSLLKQDGIV
ncbi:ankyrin repeat-containing domain protein, partial [Geopyxis carbonaria]